MLVVILPFGLHRSNESDTLNRKQERFTEQHQQEKRPRLKETDKFQGSFGPQSSSPGPWLATILVDALISDQNDESLSKPLLDGYQYQGAIEILASYGEHSRHSLDNAAKQVVDSTPNFPMIGQPNVLSGQEWLEWQRNRPMSLHSYQARLEDAEDAKRVILDAKTAVRGKGKKKPTASTKLTRIKITDEKFNADYNTWFDAAKSNDACAFFETLYHFLVGKTRMVMASENVKRREQADDFQQDFAIEMMAALAAKKIAGERLEKPANYVTRSWTNGRIDANTAISKHDKMFPSVQTGKDSTDEDENYVTKDLVNRRDANEWLRGSKHIEPQRDEDALYLERMAKLPMLDPGLRDATGMHLAGHTQRQIAQVLGITQQAVSKKLVKISSQLQTPRKSEDAA
ncbi:hypothetical protein [Granulicella tundricola]|uniref:Uncharacterized protein n=1 Tax=Granulicella tundricola (strain ATCC BAA-1859 / DSM 23138 / MP5ACTX9) TaxID=1198114 RepID=E8X1B7_GRATM|nr:hypothetical protein [Granulicella tundricola]ADW69071.1 hypothetical protein AciX9_2026 [Granulicella tundricola MP5ACTX9]